MNQMTFNVYCRERLRRTEILAGSAADAPLLIHCRDAEGSFIFRIEFHQFDCPDRTPARTVAATDPVSLHDAIVKIDDCVTDLCRGFLFPGDFKNGIVGADLGTSGAFRTAESPFVRHFRLHKGVQGS